MARACDRPLGAGRLAASSKAFVGSFGVSVVALALDAALLFGLTE